ncbi:PREDICTED: long-chain fatty acid transport protein 4-like [Nicrophorus vespilloides]|uniref:Long-chain-fatty-acid--CoA ligase n=1 Tax=Nicrophorus vespilloides TaxID=110193 RepID=A0ABM1MER9_NICVS|nr:PREDICTED: long-chain fatty acid transport protein 4-like [Nicrophorus vespilloides]
MRSYKTRPVRVVLRRVMVIMIISAILAAVAALVWYFLGWQSVVQLVLVAIVAYLATGKYKWFVVAIKTAPRDIRALFGYIRLLIQIKGYQRKNLILADIFQQHVKKHPNKTCIIYDDQEWTFAEVEEYSNKIANVFKSHGYKKGDIVALYLENKPEYICTWLGLSKLGVIVPLINTNLRLNSLVHSITVAKSQAVIFGAELSQAVKDVLDKIESKVALYELTSLREQPHPLHTSFQNLNALLAEANPTPPTITDKVGYHDNLVYIYTSGTTGLPKAAVISNSRYIFIAAAIHWLARFKSCDRFYTPLPLYHTAGGCMSTGQMLIFGSTLVIRKKFSASSYFTDIRKYDCTVAQYIGEMCRYILAVPSNPDESIHKLRLIFGNGLRPQIWTEFVDRFQIPRVAEFYGATEGNANIVNVDNTVGAIGFISRIIPAVYPISIIKVDPTTGEPIRDAHGLCMLCKANEPGVFIGKIIPGNPSRAFLGYVDKEASQKKIVHDVFKKGDSAFLSGDILVADELGNLFFKDRTGDTFRWKGENVSTSEVEAVLSNLAAYKDVVVYGVEIRGQEGRAGMAAILDPEGTLEFRGLADGIKKGLPSYARPIFIRTLTKLDMTGTYKLKKVDLQKEGFDPKAITDNIYYLDNSGQYQHLTPEVYAKINDGSIRL